jgi:hypothetical protein
MSREFPKNNPPENTSTKITLPTVGRIVHVFGNWERNVPADTPRVGIVCGTDGLTISAAVWASDGSMDPGGVQSIRHKSEKFGGPNYPEGIWWDWMDFQKGQAAKTEQLEAQLKGEMGKLQAGAPSPVDGKR